MDNEYLELALEIKKRLINNLDDAIRKNEGANAFTSRYIEQTMNEIILSTGYDMLKNKIKKSEEI